MGTNLDNKPFVCRCGGSGSLPRRTTLRRRVGRCGHLVVGWVVVALTGRGVQGSERDAQTTAGRSRRGRGSSECRLACATRCAGQRRGW